MSDIGIDDVFWSASAAAVQGWDDPELQQILRAEVAPFAPRNNVIADLNRDLTTARLGVLERQERFEEYLRLASAAGESADCASMLLRLGRVAAAIEAALTQLSTVAEALSLAQMLRERGELDQALRLAEHGLSLNGPKVQLATWLCDVASSRGQSDLALRAAVIVFREDPSLTAYERVRELAGAVWPRYREELLDHLRTRRSFSPRGPVDVFLHEKLIDDAIAAVDQSGAYEVIERVVEAASESRPEWVIQTCRRHAEAIMDRAQAQHYLDAARWLGHARKYKLRPLLEVLGH